MYYSTLQGKIIESIKNSVNMTSFQRMIETWVLPKVFYNERISATCKKYWTKEKI